jgi:hypothetical protein
MNLSAFLTDRIDRYTRRPLSWHMAVFRAVRASLALSLVLAHPCNATPPVSCETLLKRMDALSASLDRTINKKIAARMETELGKLSDQYAKQCGRPAAVTSGRSPVRPSFPASGQAAYPEEEIQRRRTMINQKKQGNQRALAIEGSIQIESGTTSSFYGKVKQELAYTIHETFVGNLMVSRNPTTGREDYAIQTISTEIDAATFNGRSCDKYAGSPPVCAHWHKIDMWQIADGEEYPGRVDGVVSAASDGSGVTLRVDGPDIEFASSQDPAAVITPRCGDQIRISVSRDEFRQWLRRANVQIKREVGKVSPDCRPGSTFTLEMRIGSE